MAAAGVLLAAGSLAGAAGRPEGLVLVGAAFGVFQWSMAAADARLQERISDRSRATVTSLAGWGSEVLSVLIFAGYAAGSVQAGPGALFAVAGVPYVMVALVLWGAARRAARRPVPELEPEPEPDELDPELESAPAPDAGAELEREGPGA